MRTHAPSSCRDVHLNPRDHMSPAPLSPRSRKATMSVVVSAAKSAAAQHSALTITATMPRALQARAHQASRPSARRSRSGSGRGVGRAECFGRAQVVWRTPTGTIAGILPSAFLC
mgnify:CR=1 FL=1